MTPARLELHEVALVGTELHAGSVFGSYAPWGSYAASGPGDNEVDLEEDVFGAVRVLKRGQVALLIPVVETYRSENDGRGFGGGIGDVNASVRYDFLTAGESSIVPGVALLAGVTAPTGKPPEAATAGLLGVDATGIGAWQVNGALALEQTFGPWLVNATAIVAARTPRFGQTLAPQFTFLGAGAYTFENDAALAVSLSYAFEGDATCAIASCGATRGSVVVANSSKSLTVVTVSGLWPVTDAWRLLASVFLDPPLSGFGSNQTASVGATLTVIRSWF